VIAQTGSGMAGPESHNSPPFRLDRFCAFHRQAAGPIALAAVCAGAKRKPASTAARTADDEADDL